MIQRLPDILIDRIAAGEVIDGPHSAVKELVENSIDAGAASIQIFTSGAGLNEIVVQDDGNGIAYDDLPLAMERYATSKINQLEDIEKIRTFGFRGEALASIASVSHLTIRSRSVASDRGGILECRAGDMIRHEPFAANAGTTISVKDLFYATPARKKFIKSERGENSRVYKAIIKIAIANPHIAFFYTKDHKPILKLSAAIDLKQRLTDIFGEPIENHLLNVSLETSHLKLSGFLGDMSYYRSSNDHQFSFVNGRPVEIRHLPYLVKKSYEGMIPSSAKPFYALFLSVDPARVDVNVHPSKKEVRLIDESLLHSLVIKATSQTLRKDSPVTASESGVVDHVLRRMHQKSAYDGFYFANSLIDKRDSLFINRTSTSIHSDDRLHALNEKSSIESDTFVKKTFLPLKHVGLFFGTYILAEDNDSIYFIDQHAAHERINYEKQRRSFERERNVRQPLLTPIVLTCTPPELDLIIESRERIQENGFVVEQISDNAYVVREVPVYIDAGSENEILSQLIYKIATGEESLNVYDEYAAMRACRASIKKNDVVSNEVISSILRELAQCDDPTRCPHGRPTMIRLSESDLDKMFGRIL